jgi:imidazolonepropionase-like amidohydrolase
MYTLIKSRQLIADTRQPPIPNGAVLVEGERILAAGTPASVPVPADAQLLDCTQDTVMPGLIDSHTHITANNKYKVPLDTHYTIDYTTAVLRGVGNLRDDLVTGVTTMRALGDREDAELRFRDCIDRGEIAGPRLVICIEALRPSHGTAKFLGTACDGPDALRKRIRELFSMGAQCVKLFASNIQNGERYEDYLASDLTDVPAYTREELSAAIDEAHRLGMTVAAHAIGGPAMRWAIEAGIDSVEHANLLEEEDIPYFLKAGTMLSDPNLQLFFDPDTGFETLASWQIDWWRPKVIKSREHTRKYIPQAIRAGVKVALATDSTHATLWKEIELLVHIGATPAEALQAVTVNSARLLKMDNKVGTIEPVKYADIISLRGDPLADISAIRRVNLVMKGGRQYQNLVA